MRIRVVMKASFGLNLLKYFKPVAGDKQPRLETVGEPSGGGDLECESQTCGEPSGELYQYELDELAGDGEYVW